MESEKTVYLDHAAATPLDPRVLEAMRPWLEDEFYNPSSLYASARLARAQVESCRHRVAQVLGAKKTEIIFTAGGTESVNLAILGTVRALKKEHAVNSAKVAASAIEHESVLACLEVLAEEGCETVLVPVLPDGVVRPEAVAEAIDDQTVLVSVMSANNEIGTIQPIAKIAKVIAAVRLDRQKRGVETPVYLHADACQAAGALDLHVSRLGVDLMTLNGSKIYGPKQTGCLYVRTGVKLNPVVYGGGQERRLRSGTENVAGIVGFATALELAQAERADEARRLSGLRDQLWQRLQAAIPDLILNGHAGKRLPGNLNMSIPGIDGEAAVLYLDQAGIMASTGSACSTGRTDPSPVLLAIGRTAAEANGSLRLTLGRTTTAADIDYAAKTLPVIVRRLRELNKP